MIKILGVGGIGGTVRERSFSRAAGGCSLTAGRQSTNPGRWTIAVEVEEGAGMFHEKSEGTPSASMVSQMSAANLSTHW